MPNRFFCPNEQFCDNTGQPYAGGSLTFYASGTSTQLATYSDRALTIANTNPVLLDSAGRAGNIFLQNLAYKVVLSQLNSDGTFTPVWTEDPVYSSDFSTTAAFQSGFGSPNGVVAGTAGSPTISASSYWDATNNILYICTQTGTASTAVWTAVNASTAASVTPPPQGYLTLTSGTPIIPSDVIGAGAVIYTPYVGNLIPIYNGSSFVPTVFSELTLTLSTSQASNTIYDVFAFNNSGVVTLVTGPAWSSSAAGSGSRGTGSGTTQLSRVNGILVNAVQITGRNNATSYTINASLATYLGSIFIDATAGQVTCHRSYGQSRKWGVWNCYNRNPVILQAGDSTASWAYSTNTIRPSNNNTANSLTVFAGLQEFQPTISFTQYVNAAGGNLSTNIQYKVGVGWNSTTAFSGTNGNNVQNGGSSGGFALTTQYIGQSFYIPSPILGVGVATSLEVTSAAQNSATYLGTSSNMNMTASWVG